MPSVYNAADAVVLGSLREGFSLSLIEALACGRPALVSEVGGNREALGEGGLTGWLHRAGDEATLAGHMCHAAALGVEGLRRMESACRLRSENFNLDKLVENTHLLYGNLLGRFPQ
jgi:glycosyltransferase involved in cell wall biosynthesis